MGEPQTYLPLDEDGQPDRSRVEVKLMQHKPGDTQALADWSGGTVALVNGGPAVVLSGAGGVVGLGDYALRYPSGRVRVEHADGFARRYTPADQHDDQEA